MNFVSCIIIKLYIVKSLQETHRQ